MFAVDSQLFRHLHPDCESCPVSGVSRDYNSGFQALKALNPDAYFAADQKFVFVKNTEWDCLPAYAPLSEHIAFPGDKGEDKLGSSKLCRCAGTA